MYKKTPPHVNYEKKHACMREELGNRKVNPKVFQKFAFAFETWRNVSYHLQGFLSTKHMMELQQFGRRNVFLGNSTGKLLFAKPVDSE